jgi:hypothetical protein
MSEGEIKRIGKEELAKLLEKAEELPVEGKYLLFLSSGNRPGEAFMDVYDFEVIYGEAEMVKLEHRYNYPHENSTRYMIIPKTIPVIVHWWRRNDYSGDIEEEEEFWVFTKDGWKCVEVK